MNRCLLPWATNKKPKSGFVRNNMGGVYAAYISNSDCYRWFYYDMEGSFHCADYDVTYASATDAMQAVDKHLIACGYELLTAERAEKLKLLL